MGQLILEIPQNVNLTFRIESEKEATEILEQLKRSKFEQAVARGEIELPKRHRLKEDGDEVLGIWADRPESGQEIARQIRERNRKVT